MVWRLKEREREKEKERERERERFTIIWFRVRVLIRYVAEYDGSSLILLLVLKSLLGFERDRVAEVEAGHSYSTVILTDWELVCYVRAHVCTCVWVVVLCTCTCVWV